MDDLIHRREFTEYSKRMEDEHDRQNARIKMLEEQIQEIHNISRSVDKLACNMESMLLELQQQNETHKRFGERIGKLESRDGAMWQKVVSHAITTGVGIVLAFIFMKLGM